MYGGKVEKADAYADSRFERAEAIAKAESARGELRRAEEALVKAEDAFEKARRESGEPAHAWSELWSSVTASPLSPHEMRAWRVKAEDAKRLFDALASTEADILALRAACDAHTNALRLGLAKIGFATKTALLKRCATSRRIVWGRCVRKRGAEMSCSGKRKSLAETLSESSREFTEFEAELTGLGKSMVPRS